MCRSRRWLFACLVALSVAVVGTFAACGGGGGDDDNDFDFNGTWSMTSMILESNVPGFPAGSSGTDIARVTQSGTTISVAVEGVAVQNGTCDPKAGTFTVSGVAGGVTIATNGTKVDENTISGTWTMAGGPYFGRATFTAELVSRSRAAAAPGGGTGLLRSALQSVR